MSMVENCGKYWIPCELHTHTLHSDALHSLMEMAEEARKLDIDWIALTDHNTVSPHLEIEEATSKTGLQIMKGLEWTTFFGHMLTIGISSYVDWRNLGLADLHIGIEKVHEQHGVVGIAHPFRVGSPMCTGCYWEYEIHDWNEIDFMEVWSGIFPSVKQTNLRALDWWTEVLNHGHRLSATSGRDWHHSKDVYGPLALTFLGVGYDELVGDQNSSVLTRSNLAMNPTASVSEKPLSEETMVSALRSGRAVVTMGPLLLMELEVPSGDVDRGKGDGKIHGIGETFSISNSMIDSEPMAHAHISMDFTVRRKHWEVYLPEQDLEVKIISNLGALGTAKVNEEASNVSVELPLSRLKWLRAELYGVMHDVRTLIAFTNPIYGGAK